LLNSNINASYYNKISKYYDQKHEINIDDYQYFLRQLKRLLKREKIKSGSKVLDCGCGTGRGALKFSKMGCEVTAVDISGDILEICEQNGKNFNLSLETRIENCNYLSFLSETFDYVTLSAALHHMQNLEKCLSEFYRVTKKGGALILIAEPKKSLLRPKWVLERKENLSGKYDKIVGNIESMKINPDIHIFEIDNLITKLKDVGYVDIHVNYYFILSSLYRDLLFFNIYKRKIRKNLLNLFQVIDERILFWLPKEFCSLFNLVAYKP
jgi:ubiquinone/menaquinone biosynthesis C-methylase UbiE